MGKSYERDGLLGKYVEHYDDDGNKIGESREREGLLGKYVEHTDAAGNKIGESRDREGFFGAYTEHTDTAGRKTGESRDREGFLGSYKEHTDRSGRRAGESREREGFLGRYTEHEGTGHRVVESRGVDSQPSSDNGCAQVLGYLVGIVIVVMVVIWLALNIVLPVLLLNSALILTILAVFLKPQRMLLAGLALLGASYMLIDIGNAWFSANFVNNVVKDPQWITGFVWLNAAAVAVSAWLLIQPLWAKAVVLRTSGTRKDLQYSMLLFGASVLLVFTPAALIPTIYYRAGNSSTSVAQSSSSASPPTISPGTSTTSPERGPQIGYVGGTLGPTGAPGGESQLVMSREGDGGGQYIFASVARGGDREKAEINIDGQVYTIFPLGREREATALDQTTGADRNYWVSFYYPDDHSFEVEIWKGYGEMGGDCSEVFGYIIVRKGGETHERVEGMACSF